MEMLFVIQLGPPRGQKTLEELLHSKGGQRRQQAHGQRFPSYEGKCKQGETIWLNKKLKDLYCTEDY